MQRTAGLQLLQGRCKQVIAAFQAIHEHLQHSNCGVLHQLAGQSEHQHAAGSSQVLFPWSCSFVRLMGGRTHKLSLKRPNNRASWLAVQPFLKEKPPAAADKAPVIESAIPALPKLREPPPLRLIGKITGPYAVSRQAAFAVMQSSSAQFKVTADDIIYHNKIPGVQVNDVLEFGKVLLVGTQAETTIGRPFIPEASVVAVVEEVFKDAKVHVFKKKKRKRYSKLKGHRSQITALRILELRGPGVQQQLTTGNSNSSSELGAANVANVAPPPPATAAGADSSDSRNSPTAAAAAAAASAAPTKPTSSNHRGPPPAVLGVLGLMR
jgi:large subunit ribosomal protein L21